MHDVLAFEERGIPTVLLCTEPFIDSACEHAAAFGNPEYQSVRVGHPLASLPPEQARARADEALGGVIAILTGQAGHTVTPRQEPQ
ncbi:MAG TPA: hypothetical protein VLK82_14200 [Candidatus Tectomicrobia bacterium]|nr:hypothetical protein [Candidatus Tectomicrobia bacterium]